MHSLHEKNYHQSLILANRNNWAIIKQVINKSKYSTPSTEFYYNGCFLKDKKSIANVFNKYFVNIGPKLAYQIPDLGINYRNCMPLQISLSIVLIPIEESEAKEIFAQLKDGAPGKDEITSKGIKCITDHIAILLTRLTNLSFSCGVFLINSKLFLCHLCIKQKIRWSPATTDLFLCSQYFQNFRKIGKLVYDRLSNFLTKCKMINDNQFGFRNNHSTYMALLIMHENIRNVLDNGECAIGIFLDFQKAFDTIGYDILSKISKTHLTLLTISYQTNYMIMVSEEFHWNGSIATCLIDIKLLNMIIMNQSLVK